MDAPREAPRQPVSPTKLAMEPGSLIRKSTIVYGIMILLGAAVVYFAHKKLDLGLALPAGPMEAGRLVAIGCLGGGLLLVLSYFFEDWFPSFRALKSTIMRFLGPVSVPMAIYLAVLTSFGEELLFRGAVQPFAGIVFTAVLFGLLHLGQDGLVSAWSVWAVIAGLLLGWMYAETGSLWPPIIAHFSVNVVSILNLRRAYRSWKEHVQKHEGRLTPQDLRPPP